MTGDQHKLVFRVGEARFALPAAQVREVARLPRLARIPHAPDGLLGIGNFRGAAVPVVSLAALVDETSAAARRAVLVDGDTPVALVVDTVESVGQDGDALALDLDGLLGKAFGQIAPRHTAMAIVPESENDAAVRATVSLLALLVGGQEFALPLEQVEEVLPLPESLTLLPNADAVVAGSMGYHGTVLPLLWLHRLLGLQTVVRSKRPRVVIARLGQHRFGLIVDGMRSVLRVDPDAIDPVPHVLTRGSSEATIQAIARLDGGRRLVSVLSVEHLLREDVTMNLLQGTEKEAQMAGAAGVEATEQFLIFRVGDQDFGLPIAAVEEVVLLPEQLTPLPKAPAFVEGVMNLRGRVVPVIDQRTRFDGTPSSGKRRRVIVVRIGALEAGFIVDAARETIRVPVSCLRDAPELGGGDTRVFDRVANLADPQRIVLIVSPQELLDRAERDLLAGLR